VQLSLPTWDRRGARGAFRVLVLKLLLAGLRERGSKNGSAVSMVASDGKPDAAPSGDGIDDPLAPTLSAAQMEAATIELDHELDCDEGTTSVIDTRGGAWRLIEVPAASNAPNIMYRSWDGIHWQAVPFAPGPDDLPFPQNDAVSQHGKLELDRVERRSGRSWRCAGSTPHTHTHGRARA